MPDRVLEIAEGSAKGGFSLFLGDASSTIILAIGSILIARFLGPSDYGVYALALVVPILLASAIGFGIDYALIRFPAKFRAEGRSGLAVRTLRSGLKFRLLTGVAVSIFVFLFSDFFATYLLNRPEMGFYVKLASLVIFFQAIFNSACHAFIGLDRMGRSALLKGSMSVVKASLAPLLILFGFGIAGAILGHVLGYVVAGVAGLFMLFVGPLRTKKSSSNIADGSFSRDLKLMVRYGFPLYLSSLLLIFMSQYQLIILTSHVSNLEIGNFNAAVNLSALLTILILPTAMAIFPAFSKFNPVAERAELKRFFNHSIKYTSLFVVPASVAVMILSGDIVRVVYGSGYGLTPIFLSLYVVVFLYAGLGYRVLESFFNGVGETKLTLKTYLLNIAIFIPLAPLLAQLYGTLGLISAFLASNLTSVLYGLSLLRKRFTLGLNLSDQLKIYLASTLSILPAFLFLQLSPFGSLLNLVFGGSLFLFTYLSLAPALGAVRARDIENLKSIFSKIKVLWPFLKLILAYETKLISKLSSFTR